MMQSDFWIRVTPISGEDSFADVSPKIRELVEKFGSAKRRAESYAWRALLARELGADVEVEYNEVGAPILVNREGYIGVSHCNSRVALIYSRHTTVAIDIEELGRSFEGVSPRYLTPRERTLNSHPNWLAMAWCAKECLYKMAGRKAIDLLKDIELQGVEQTCDHLAEGIITARCCGADYVLHYFFEGDCVVVWCRL